MKSALSVQMCRLESPSRSAESEPENVLNTASPGRCSSWILPHEMMTTPDRPTTGGLQSPVGVPVQLGPGPLTQEYCPKTVVEVHAEDLQLNGEITMLEKMKRSVNYFEVYLEDDPTQDVFDLEHGTEHQVELNIAAAPSPSNCSSSNMTAPKCVNGHLVRPEPPSDDAPSTACNSSSVTASGGVGLLKADPPCFGTPPEIRPVPSRQLPPPPPPPASSCSSNPARHAPVYPRQWTPLNTRPKSSGGGPPDESNNGGSGSGGGDPNNLVKTVASYRRVLAKNQVISAFSCPVSPPGIKSHQRGDGLGAGVQVAVQSSALQQGKLWRVHGHTGSRLAEALVQPCRETRDGHCCSLFLESLSPEKVETFCMPGSCQDFLESKAVGVQIDKTCTKLLIIGNGGSGRTGTPDPHPWHQTKKKKPQPTARPGLTGQTLRQLLSILRALRFDALLGPAAVPLATPSPPSFPRRVTRVWSQIWT